MVFAKTNHWSQENSQVYEMPNCFENWLSEILAYEMVNITKALDSHYLQLSLKERTLLKKRCYLIGFLAKDIIENELSGLHLYCHLNGEITSGIISVSVNEFLAGNMQ